MSEAETQWADSISAALASLESQIETYKEIFSLPCIPEFQYPEYIPISMQHDVVGNHFTPAWNAERFIERYQNIVKYCAPKKQYYLWDGYFWKPDAYNEVHRLCFEQIHDMICDPVAISHAPLLKHLAGSISSSKIRDMMFFVEANRITVREEEIDADPDRVNVLNGVLNLDIVEWEAPNRDRFITRRMGVAYDPGAKCPLWLAHLNLIFDGDQETIKSFQMIAGYSLLRTNPEQVFFICHGEGENGKSVTLNVLSHILGEYAMNADPRTFMFRRADDTSVRSDVARLYKAHLVTSMESGEGVRLNEGLLKAITGHDKITSRELYEKEQERYLEAKVFFATNHEPTIKDASHGMLRRILKIPFAVQIPAGKRDDQIERKLIEEAPGILNWILDGLRAWKDNGRKLKLSTAITDATSAFRNSIDEYREFFMDDIEVTTGGDHRVLKQTLYDQFCLWYSDKYGEQPSIKFQAFNKVCHSHGITLDNRTRTGKWEWLGVRILSSVEREERKKTSEKSAYACVKCQNDERMNGDEPHPVTYPVKSCTRNLLDKVHQGSSVHHSDVNRYICGSMCSDIEQKKCVSVPSKCGRGVLP